MSGMFSTKGKYALRAMADLATHDGWISLGDVSRRQNISRKYLEQVISLMHKAGYVESQRGKGGGYRLTRAPGQYTVGSVLRLTEKSLAPVPCVEQEGCARAAECRMLPLWQGLDRVITEYLDGFTIEDLMRQSEPGNDYVI